MCEADLLQIIADAIKPLERLALEEIRGNRGRLKAGLPKQTKANELWLRARAAVEHNLKAANVWTVTRARS